MKQTPFFYDLTYACFAFGGIVALAIGGTGYFPMSETTAAGLGFLVFLPLSVVALVVVSIGMLMSLFLRHEPLYVLAGVTFLVVLGFLNGSQVWDYDASWVVYGIFAVGMSASWLRSRKRTRLRR